MTTAASKRGKRSVRKGKKHEKHVADRINDIPRWEAEHRIPQGRSGGKNNPDVRASCGDTHLHIECNHSRRPPVPAKWRQAVRDCGPGTYPVAWILFGQRAVAEVTTEIVLVSWDWLIQAARPDWIWPAEAGNAKAALNKATRKVWTGCTPVGAWGLDGQRIAVLWASDFLHILREIAIDTR